MAAGDGRSRVDIGRCEAQGGAPRPPPQPTGPRGPLGPCTARLVPCRRPQHPRLDPRQHPRLVALMEAWGVRERPWWVLSGVGPTQTQKASPPAPPGVCRAMGCPLVAWKWPRAARVTSMSRLGVPRVLFGLLSVIARPPVTSRAGRERSVGTHRYLSGMSGVVRAVNPTIM